MLVQTYENATSGFLLVVLDEQGAIKQLQKSQATILRESRGACISFEERLNHAYYSRHVHVALIDSKAMPLRLWQNKNGGMDELRRVNTRLYIH